MQLLRKSYKIKLQISVLKLISKFDTINEINSNTLLVNYHLLCIKCAPIQDKIFSIRIRKYFQYKIGSSVLIIKLIND